MPNLPLRRRRRATASATAVATRTLARSRPETAGLVHGAGSRHWLYQAASCFLRADAPAEAADCLRYLGEHEWAARLYLEAESYEQAALTYAEAGMPEVAGWIYVHNLGRPEAARAVLHDTSQTAAYPAPAQRRIDVEGRTRLSAWHSQIGLIRDRFTGSAAAGDPAANPAAMAVRRRIVSLTAELIGDSGGRRDLGPFLAQATEIKNTAIGQDDWPAGYAARELERLLIDEHDAREANRESAGQQSHQALERSLARRQVQARCDAAERMGEDRIISVLTETQELLANPGMPVMQRAEEWAVAIAEAIRRYDHVALTFSAAVRGRRPGALVRWQEWSARVLKADVTTPVEWS